MTPEVARRAVATVSKSCIGNARLVGAVINVKGEDFLHQHALEDERRVRINRTVPTCILAAFEEWATCSKHSSSCSGEFTQATLLYLTGIKGFIGLEHCARVIGAHLGHRGKGMVFPRDTTTKRLEYTLPSAVHVVFSAHMAAVLDQIDADSRVFSHEVANPHSQMYVDLGRILLDILRQLFQNDVVIINTLDEYEVPGRDFLLAHNIPRLSLRTLAYFPDIIRYFIASRGSKEGQELYKQIFKHLYDYVREHLATIVSDPRWHSRN